MTRRLRIMLSSRCYDKVRFDDGPVVLSDFRKDLKKRLEAEEFLGDTVFEVWINEDAPPAPGDESSWEHCLTQAEDSEIFICLYNGDAGGAAYAGDIGICHAELETALKTGASKVQLVKLPEKKKPNLRDKQFAEYIKKQSQFRGGTVKTREDAVERVFQAIRTALIGLARRGRTHSKKDRYDSGQALEWSRMSFAMRKTAMEAIVLSNLLSRGAEEKELGLVCLSTLHKPLLVRVAALPGPFGTAEARELVGRPHLQDYRQEQALAESKAHGPLHLVACHRGVTENQALGVLGFPDAISIASGFGVYVADDVRKAQLVFLQDCRDPSATRHAVQLFFDWLERSGEADEVIERAQCRRRIVKALAKEQARG